MFDVLDHTWPAAATHICGPWDVRDGQGGGKRVSSATARDAVWPLDIAAAEAGHDRLGQTHLFMIRPGDGDLDAALSDRGYDILDPTVILACDIRALTTEPVPPVTAFVIWEPLAIATEIWEAGGIGVARRAVMARAKGPRTAILGRTDARPAGAAFAAICQGCAMVHAVEVVPAYRRRGLARWMMRAAAVWAQENGADRVAVACTKANAAACALYSSLGMTPVGEYHYRQKAEGSAP